MNLTELQSEIPKISQTLPKLKKILGAYEKVIILGNGGSNSIASHIAEDYTKVLNKKAISFSDGARLTCYINDYGFDHCYSKFIEHFGDTSTLTILISSSGESPNILSAASYCQINNIPLVTLSGFKPTNSLNSFPSLLSYYVPSQDYGVTENAHQIFLHSIL